MYSIMALFMSCYYVLDTAYLAVGSKEYPELETETYWNCVAWRIGMLATACSGIVAHTIRGRFEAR